MNSRRPGRFVTLEGIDGAGKSTHVAWLASEIAAVWPSTPGAVNPTRAGPSLVTAEPRTTA